MSRNIVPTRVGIPFSDGSDAFSLPGRKLFPTGVGMFFVHNYYIDFTRYKVRILTKK